MQTPPLQPLTESFRVDDLVLNAPAGLIRFSHLFSLSNQAYEAPEIALASALIRPGLRVLEFGGGIGIVSRHIAGLTGPDCVLSVEANPAAMAVAQDHLARDGLGVAHRWGMVVAEGSAPQSLGVDPESFLASRPLPRTDAALSPPAHSLSALLADWQPQVLVVDIEGGEAGLFAPTDLARVQALVVELHPAMIGADGCMGVVRDLAAQGLLTDPALVAGPVLGFSRTPSGPPPLDTALHALFTRLADADGGGNANAPSADLATIAQTIPASPLLYLLAMTALPRPDPARRTGLTTLLSHPMTAARARTLLANDLLTAGEDDAALALLAVPETGHDHWLKARALLPLQRPREALPHARAATEALPWFAQAHFLHARAALATADRPAARQATATAQSLDPALPGLTEFAARLAKLP